MNNEFRTVREIKRTYGISRTMLQRYERIGLIHHSCHNKYGHLLYDIMTVRRISFIRHLQNCGFELPEIKVLSEMDVPNLKRALNDRIKTLEEKMEHIEVLINKTRNIIDVLGCFDEPRIDEIVLRKEK